VLENNGGELYSSTQLQPLWSGRKTIIIKAKSDCCEAENIKNRYGAEHPLVSHKTKGSIISGPLFLRN
jgi:hypothetical protein